MEAHGKCLFCRLKIQFKKTKSFLKLFNIKMFATKNIYLYFNIKKLYTVLNIMKGKQSYLKTVNNALIKNPTRFYRRHPYCIVYSN